VVRTPLLPPALANAGPQSQDTIVASIRVFDLFSVTNYAGLRTLPSSTPMCLECALNSGDISHVVASP